MKEVIADPVRIASQKWPHKTALISDNTSLSFAEFDSAIDSAIFYLLKHNIEPEQTIAVLSRNKLSFTVLFWAVYRLGATLLPLSCLASSIDWKDQLDNTDCKVLFYGESFAEYSGIVPDSHPLKIRYEAPEVEINKKAYQFLDQSATFLYTSGSTGKPRGVVLNWGNIYYSALGVNSALHMTEDDLWIAVLPFYHIGGLSILFRAALTGSAVRVYNRFTPESILDAIHEKSSCVLSVVPTMFKDLIKTDKNNLLKRCKAIILGGAASDKQLRQEIADRDLPVLTTYGMTETASMVTLLPFDKKGTHLDSAGKVLERREVKSDQNGRILVRGATLFDEYVLSARAVDPDGWFDTGDLGYIDGNDMLYVTGRDDRIIISGGENLDLGRIEQVILEHPDVKAALVLSRPDDKWGTRPVAFVLPSADILDDEEVQRFVEALLGKVYVPDHVELIKEFPLTASGKYDIPALEKTYPEVFNNS